MAKKKSYNVDKSILENNFPKGISATNSSKAAIAEIITVLGDDKKETKGEKDKPVV